MLEISCVKAHDDTTLLYFKIGKIYQVIYLDQKPLPPWLDSDHVQDVAQWNDNCSSTHINYTQVTKTVRHPHIIPFSMYVKKYIFTY
jgi:hypothetical protein